jgi:hypothetical protein
MTLLVRGASLALAFGTSLRMGTACSGGSGPTCDCVDPALTVAIPADIASSVTGVELSGNACAGVTPECAQQAEGCSLYRFDAIAAGNCHVEVDSASGVFTADVTITQMTGCCAGLYATPESAASILVPEPDGGGG